MALTLFYSVAIMFFRLKKTPTGQVLQLTESYRNGDGKPRQRVVLSLGDAFIEEADKKAIAKSVEKKLYGIEELFPSENSRNARQWIDRIIKRVERDGRWRPLREASGNEESSSSAEVLDGVLVDKVTHTNTSQLGPFLVGLHAWQSLGMGDFLKNLEFTNAQCYAAVVSVINRLVEPLSENALLDWLPGTALPELLNFELTPKSKDRFYRISDKLLEYESKIMKHLRVKQESIFNYDKSIILYDLTNTHFEGGCGRNQKAKRGRNKQKRNDCPQIVVGMVFNCDGFELGHKIFEGTRSDSKSLIDMIKDLESLLEPGSILKETKPLIILDSGIATRKNLTLLRDKGFSYLVNDNRRGRLKYKEEFLSGEGFEIISGRNKAPDVQVRVINDPQPFKAKTENPSEAKNKVKEEFAERIVLCKSENRREKELAIFSSSEKKYSEALNKLVKRVEEGDLKDPKKIERAIGRLQSKSPRVNRYYDVQLVELAPPASTEKESSKEKVLPSKRVQVTRKDKTSSETELCGCYVLRTDLKNLSADEVWKLYMMLTRAEDGFKALKSSLGLRPNRHHREDRVDAHVCITIMAYHLLRFILYTLENLGDNRDWETIKRVLRTHCYTTIIIPTAKGITYRIRKAGEPEETQKEIYRALGVDWKKLPTKKIVASKN